MEALCLFLGLYRIILLARVILSWIPAPPDALRPVVAFIYAITEPILRPIRPLIPPLRVGAVALDLSILLVFFLLLFLQSAICT